MMLPASDLAEIVTNLVGLRLEPDTTAQILAAVLPPLLRSSTEDFLPDKPAHTQRRSPPWRKREKSEPRVATNGGGDSPISRRQVARQRAIAALKANPDATLTAVAKAAGVSRGTVVNAKDDLAAEARKAARKARKSGEASQAAKPERRQRAERFLKDALAHGPKQVSDLEAAAEKAHIDVHTLAQARAELGVVTSRGNAGGVQAVQWSLPG